MCVISERKMSAEKRRKVTRLGKRCDIVGSSRDLPLADLTTYGDILCKLATRKEYHKLQR